MRDQVPVCPHSDFTHASIPSNTVIVPDSATVTAADVTVSAGAGLRLGASATVDANLFMNGILDPIHGDVGSATIDGNLTLGSTATYKVDLKGTSTDSVAVSGDVQLAGTVQFVAHGPVTSDEGNKGFKAGTYSILTSTGTRSGTFASSTGLGAYVSGSGLSYPGNAVTVTTLKALHAGDANMDTKTDVSDHNIWMQWRFTQELGGGGTLLDGDNLIDVVYDPDTGIMTVDTTGTHLRSLIVPSPQASTVDRWQEDEYQDNVFWTQNYSDAKEQWGGTGGTYVPEAVYQIATYATGLSAEDFGEVEFATYERDILYTTVQVLGEGLRARGGPESMRLAAATAAATDAALASAPVDQRAAAAAAWLYQYDPASRVNRTGQPPAILPAAVDVLLASV